MKHLKAFADNIKPVELSTNPLWSKGEVFVKLQTHPFPRNFIWNWIGFQLFTSFISFLRQKTGHGYNSDKKAWHENVYRYRGDVNSILATKAKLRYLKICISFLPAYIPRQLRVGLLPWSCSNYYWEFPLCTTFDFFWRLSRLVFLLVFLTFFEVISITGSAWSSCVVTRQRYLMNEHSCCLRNGQMELIDEVIDIAMSTE